MSNQSLAHNINEKERSKDVILDDNVNFDVFCLSQNIFEGLLQNGFIKPSPIQLKAIPLSRCGFDLIIKSKSGTGKTLVFCITALEMINPLQNKVQTLILVPAREIAVQIVDVLRCIGSLIEGLKVESFIGGLPIAEDIEKIKNCHIAVGAPGRVKHLLNEGHFNTDGIILFVLDEADKLLETNFQDDINEIYNSLPSRKQIMALSATYPDKLAEFLVNYMLSPTFVSTEIETPLLLGLEQYVCILKCGTNPVQEMKTKNEHLLKILAGISFTQCLVFSKYQARVESVCNFLNQKGWNCIFISAALSQTQRLEAVNSLKDLKCRILLSTDLTARGIDAANVDLVINYDVPGSAITYLHRMGRAGRFGSKGVCITLALMGEDLKNFQNILGAIGGTKLSINILPDLNEKQLDLWNLNQYVAEQIYGTISTNCTLEKCDVLTIKEDKTNKKSKRKAKHTKKKDKNNADNENISITDKNNCTENEIRNLFEFIATGDTEKKEINDNTNYDNNLINLSNPNDERLKLTRFETEAEISFKQKNSNGIEKSNSVFNKNKTLYNITQLLNSPKAMVTDESKQTITNCLIKLKGELNKKSEDLQFLNSQKDCFKVVNESSNIIVENTSDNDSQPKSESDILENVFKFSYEYAIDLTKKHWLDFFPKEEIDKFEKCYLNDEETDGCEDEEDEIEEYEKQEDDEYEEIEYDKNEYIETHLNTLIDSDPLYDYSNNKTNKFDVKCNNDYEQESASNYKKSTFYVENNYLQHFDQCSHNLWQTGLMFDNVNSFDDWFHQWKNQVGSVRNYVQQNIYVEEMIKFKSTGKYS